MADGIAGPSTASDVPRARSAHRRWPVSAVCCVAVLGVLVVLLLVMNVLGMQLGRDGDYDPQAGGSVAEWLGAIGTLVALPAAVLFGIRQLRSTNEALQLGRHRLAVDRAERAERQSAELATLRSALRLQVEVTNVVDAADLAGDAELAAVERWRTEHRQRGWVPDAGTSTWQQGSARRSSAELLAAEASPLVPEPWFVAVTCRNIGPAPLTLQRWTAHVDGTAATIDAPAQLGSGVVLRRRLGAEARLARAYARRSDAEAAAARVRVVLEGCDAVGRPVRIIHPLPE